MHIEKVTLVVSYSMVVFVDVDRGQLAAYERCCFLGVRGAREGEVGLGLLSRQAFGAMLDQRLSNCSAITNHW